MSSGPVLGPVCVPGEPRLVALLHRLWRRVWSSKGEIATTRSTRAVTKGGGERVDDQQVNQQSSGHEADLEQAWWSVVGRLQPNQRAWLEASAPVTLHGDQAIIEVVDEFTRGQLEGRLRAQIEEGLTAAFGRDIRLGVTVNPQLVARPASRPLGQSHEGGQVDIS